MLKYHPFAFNELQSIAKYYHKFVDRKIVDGDKTQGATYSLSFEAKYKELVEFLEEYFSKQDDFIVEVQVSPHVYIMNITKVV